MPRQSTSWIPSAWINSYAERAASTNAPLCSPGAWADGRQRGLRDGRQVGDQALDER
jgi:hypothetical protein